MTTSTTITAPRTFFDKVWDEHRITALGPDTDLLQIDRLVLHELSGSQAVRALAEAGRAPMSRGQVFTIIEHLISTRPGRGPRRRPPGHPRARAGRRWARRPSRRGRES